jgi:hypothetical protein
MIGDDNPVKQNVPTLPELKITGSTGDSESEKRKWVALIEKMRLLLTPTSYILFLGR